MMKDEHVTIEDVLEDARGNPDLRAALFSLIRCGLSYSESWSNPPLTREQKAIVDRWVQESDLEFKPPPFRLGQRIRHKHTGRLGEFGSHNGHPAVKWDGDSFFIGITIPEWEEVINHGH